MDFCRMGYAPNIFGRIKNNNQNRKVTVPKMELAWKLAAPALLGSLYCENPYRKLPDKFSVNFRVRLAIKSWR